MNTVEATFAVAVKADGGKVTATVSSAAQPTVNVTDISLAGKSLVLKYFTDIQGNSVSTAMTLTPEGQGLRANMALMDGQYEMAGTATKQAPGTPVRAGGFGGGGGGRGSATSELTDFTSEAAISSADALPRRLPASCCPRDTASSSSPPTPI